MEKQILKDLCALDGVSGREDAVRSYILNALNASPAPKEITVDAMGNIIVRLIGKKTPSKKILFDAHMDEIGFMITHINDDGTLCFAAVGGIDKKVLFGHAVRIGQINGVIGAKAVHQCTADEKNTLPSIDSMVIDIGAQDRAGAEKLVKIGQAGTFAAELEEWENGFLMGKAIDNRVGCAILLSLAELQPEYDIWLSFSVQEEIGLRGAKVVGENVCPDVAIALDATTASDVAGSTQATCVCRVGHGAVVSFADGATLYDFDFYQHIRNLAEENDISTQTKNRIAGGNDAGALQRSYIGAQVAAISLPCRYIHSASSVCQWKDVLSMEKLVHLLADRLPL